VTICSARGPRGDLFVICDLVTFFGWTMQVGNLGDQKGRSGTNCGDQRITAPKFNKLRESKAVAGKLVDSEKMVYFTTLLEK
jgi:hypothetical protein